MMLKEIKRGELNVRYKNPAHWAPAELEKYSPQVDEHNGNVAEGRDLVKAVVRHF
jgi:hypothetical protein